MGKCSRWYEARGYIDKDQMYENFEKWLHFGWVQVVQQTTWTPDLHDLLTIYHITAARRVWRGHLTTRKQQLLVAEALLQAPLVKFKMFLWPFTADGAHPHSYLYQGPEYT